MTKARVHFRAKGKSVGFTARRNPPKDSRGKTIPTALKRSNGRKQERRPCGIRLRRQLAKKMGLDAFARRGTSDYKRIQTAYTKARSMRSCSKSCSRSSPRRRR